MTTRTQIRSFASVWDALDLGFDETQRLRLKSQLVMKLSEKITREMEEKGTSQKAMAKKYKSSQAILSWVLTGKIHNFTVGSLIKLTGRFGIKIEMTLT